MIGVLSDPSDLKIVEEFFQFFKTSWEHYRPSTDYDIVISTLEVDPPLQAKLVIQYIGSGTHTDTQICRRFQPNAAGELVSYRSQSLPLYGPIVEFHPDVTSTFRLGTTGGPVLAQYSHGAATLVKIGYDLFREILWLLTKGQPEGKAAFPTLELHIAVLRDVILGAGIAVVEIPPVPFGNRFIVCLTHDIDHPIQRNHSFDKTGWGFISRATLGSFLQLCRGRKTWSGFFRNLWAAFRYPFVLLGWADDPWLVFDRYLLLEHDAPATYFVIPFEGLPGRKQTGQAPAARACRYTVEQLQGPLTQTIQSGNEIGLHGLDAWVDQGASELERERIAHVTHYDVVGVRMHWLYFGDESLAILDRAGFTYDSTVGYNSTVGYRSGTLQAYRPLAAQRLLELPLHIMDTALFYPSHLNLREREAHLIVDRMIRNAEDFGGALTFNWHDRSIAPERLWDEFYKASLNKLRQRNVWFASAREGAGWFQTRRNAHLRFLQSDESTIEIEASAGETSSSHPLTVRVYRPKSRTKQEHLAGRYEHVDLKLDRNLTMSVTL